MKTMIPVAAVAGALLIVLAFTGRSDSQLIAGCILLGAALIAASIRPPA